MKAFLKKLGDMFLDQGGGVDEKRVFGVILIINALVYLWTHAPSSSVWIVVGGLIVLGLGAFGIAVGGDQGKLGGPILPG